MNILIPVLLVVYMCSFAPTAISSSLEGERPVAIVQTGNENYTMRTSVYLQARVESGDLIYGKKGEVLFTPIDLYFRKASVGFYGNAIYPKLTYGLTLSGDETPQDKVYPSFSEANGISLNGTYLDYKFSDQFSLRFGKEKLPYSRLYLVSSTRQVFSERPYYMFSWEAVLRTYAHTHIMAYGTMLGTLNYFFSIGKAWRKGDQIYDLTEVTFSRPQFTSRFEWSPKEWREQKLSDTPLGLGKHFTVGLYFANQQVIEYIDIQKEKNAEQRGLYGVDLSFQKQNLNLQAEINGWYVRNSRLDYEQRAIGGLVQANYYLFNWKLEPAIRYEQFYYDQQKDESKVEKSTLGLNYYFDKSNLKLMINLEYTNFGKSVTLLKPVNRSVSTSARATLQFVL